jgi:hypothetical protein
MGRLLRQAGGERQGGGDQGAGVKRDTPTRRLHELLTYEKWQRHFRVPLSELGKGEWLKDWRPNPVPEIEEEDRRLRKLWREGKDADPFQIDGAPKSLGAAFEAFGLDPKEPQNWRRLLIYLAHTHFRKDRPRGRPRNDISADVQIITDYLAISDQQPNASTDDVCRVMIKRHAKYRGVKPDAIRKRLDRANNRIDRYLSK